MLLTSESLGHGIVFNTNKPIQSKTTAIHIVLSPTTKIELMKFIGSMKFCSNFFDKLHVYMKPQYDSLHEDITFHWNNELETLFQQIETFFTKHVRC